ncbi:fibropellin-1-like isoform X2 [Mya arenaria]|uniref:fibropellin-1-like isoform X2 n=1 Tax=Mya arenaria TaxID=6604 RepID=UPI0022E06A51|nr:fibropellin-1-like isoform X2 [Mya arenaria]
MFQSSVYAFLLWIVLLLFVKDSHAAVLDVCSVDAAVCDGTPNTECDGTNCVCSAGYIATDDNLQCAYDCGVVASPNNGAVVISGDKLTATFTCDAGFKINGAGTRTCVDNTGWDGADPTCDAGVLGDDCSTNANLCINIANSQCSGTCQCDAGYAVDGAVCTDVDECNSTPCLNSAVCANLLNGYTCTCADGFEGTNCEINIDDCNNSPCQNGACEDQVNGYTCNCDAGWAGTNCDNELDECLSNPCLNSAICVDGIAGYTCTCSQGFEGVLCQNEVNACVGITCENSGTCVSTAGTYTCECAGGFEGTFCQNNTNDCVGNSCLNQGICVDGVGGYTCTCLQGFAGQFCQEDINECSSNPCVNNGACVDGENRYTCNCLTGFTGSNCETNIDDCSNTICGQGVCTDLVNDFSCACNAGYTGADCSTEIDECLSLPCENEGTCVNLVNQFKCNCAAGYTGIQCADDINECTASLCQNGATCVDRVAEYTCLCAAGYTGDFCETNINECASSPCRNDATCMDGVNGYVCDCVQGFTGTWCSTNINDCSPNPCLNGGTCIDGVNSATCTCTVGHTGDNCRPAVLGDSCFQRVDICANIANAECSGAAVCVCSAGYLQATADTCSAIDCGNLPPPDNGAVDHADGTSYNDIVVFTCDTGYLRNGASSLTCKNDGTWSGTAPTCDEVNECASNPCSNGGTCADLLNGFTCTCHPGYGGSTCIRDCGVPASTANGAVNYVEGTLVGAEATYTCDNGYQMSGSARSECQTDGTWSRHGICFVVNVAYDEVCFETAQCITTGATCRNDGLGSIKCLCAASGEQYDTNIDECLSDCGQLPNPTDGEVSNPDVTAEGQIATYTCFTGYGLVGDKRRTCQSDGHWSGAPPVCSFGCPEPNIPLNGYVNTSDGLAVGQRIYYSCVEGYELVGQFLRICESASTWSGTEPTCLVNCPLLGNIVNGKVDMSYGRHEGSLATFACNSNYALVGDPVVKCESSGVWGGIQPTCVFAMFPDIILAFGVIMVILIIIDMFIVGLCLYYKYFKGKAGRGNKGGFPDILTEEGKSGAAPTDGNLLSLKKQKFAKVKPEGAHPPPAHPDEPNVVYRSTMKMDNSVLSNIFSKGGKYNRPEDDEKSLYHDDEKTNDNGYMSQSVSQEDDLDITHMSKTPRDAKPIKEEPEGDEDEESGDRGRFWFHMRAPPANIKDTLQSAENEGGNHADAKIRSTSAAPAYKPNKRH